jgi:hypothetical protein
LISETDDSLEKKTEEWMKSIKADKKLQPANKHRKNAQPSRSRKKEQKEKKYSRYTC